MERVRGWLRWIFCLLAVVLLLCSFCRAAVPGGVTGESPESYLKRTGTYAGECRTTFYCECRRCCGKEAAHPGYGITASGEAVQEGRTLAVDPEVIPLGSDVLIRWSDGSYEWRVATDTGVKGQRIDVYLPDHGAALQGGVQITDVWWRD